MAGSIKICGDIIKPIEYAEWTGDERTSDPDLLLLDTPVWLWLVAGSSELSTEARHMIDRAVAAGSLRIAAISLWEIALLASRASPSACGLRKRWPILAPPSIRSVRRSRSKATLYQTYFIVTRLTG